MQYSKVQISGINTVNLKTMKEEEKIRLLKLAQSGDEKAREELIMGNLRLVLSSIQRFTSRGENPDDLFQIGVIGLIKAIDRFDLSIDVRFSTYAVPMILGELRRFLRDGGHFRVARSIRDTAYKSMQAKEKLQYELGREPTVEEIAKVLEKPKEEIVIALESIVEPISISEPVYSDGGDTIYVEDQLGDTNDDRNWVDEISIKDAVKKLSAREKEILSARFLRGKTQMEVAEEIGISQAQVSRLEKNALNAIKKAVQ